MIDTHKNDQILDRTRTSLRKQICKKQPDFVANGADLIVIYEKPD